MSLRKKIDYVIVNEIDDLTHIFVQGYLIDESRECQGFELTVNDQIVKLPLHTFKRPELVDRFNLDIKHEDCGFIVHCEVPKKNVSKIKLEALFGMQKINILEMNEKQVNKIKTNNTVDYRIDGLHYEESSNMWILQGWARGYFGQETTIAAVVNGNKVDVILRPMSRKDLVKYEIIDKSNKQIGFHMSFTAKPDDNVKVEFINELGITSISPSEILKERKASLFTKMRIMAHPHTMKKGVKYLKKNGVKKFVKRVLSGEMPTPDFEYHRWFLGQSPTQEDLEIQRNTKFEYEPKISIIVPVFNPPLQFFDEMVMSVIGQTYPNWQLCIADGSIGNDKLRNKIQEYANNDSRIVYTFLDDNFGIAGNTNKAMELADGDYIALFDHDDLLTLDALYEVTNTLQTEKHDIVYTDEDKLETKTNRLMDPNFKPDFSIDLFRSHNYITHLFVVKKSIMDSAGWFRSEYDGSQDYDLMFRCIEKAKSIYHLPKVLYHWRMHAASTAENPASKMYCYEAGKKAIESHYERLNIDAKVEMLPLWGLYRTIYAVKDKPLVSIIIPNMNHKETLKTCMDSIINVNTYENIEVIIIENNSNEPEIFEYYEHLESNYDYVKVVKWDKGFNYSAINNFGVKYSKGDYLLLLNNDTELISPTGIEDMLGYCIREEVGIVGAKLLYDDDTVQHAGVVIGFGGYAGHINHAIEDEECGYMMRAQIATNYSAVTAACLMIKRSIFEEINGFDEEFVVACNDVDLCLRVRETGKLVVYNPFSRWYHYESKSRGYEDTDEKIKRFQGEVALFQSKWQPLLDEGDPYYSPNFDIKKGPFAL